MELRRLTTGLRAAGLAALLSIGGVSFAAAQTTLTALVPFTKVDNQYFALEDMYARFREQHPDITIEFDFLEHDAYHTKLQALAISGGLPDIMALWPGKRTGYLTDRGFIRDLRPLIERDNLAASQKDIFLAAQGVNGEVYELGQPFVNYSNVVYANEKLLAELGLTYPATLEEMLAQVPAITAAGYRPMVFGDESSWVMQSCLLSMLTARVGGLDWFNAARTGAGGASFNDAGFVGALQIVRDMVDGGLISESEPATTREQAMSLFVSGKSVYFIGGIWEVSNLEASLSAEMKSEIGMYRFPDIAGQKTSGKSSSGALSTGYGIALASSDAEAEAAWEWVKFNIDPANADLMIKHGNIPTFKEANIEPLIEGDLKRATYTFASGIDTVLPVIDDKMDAEGVNEIVNAGLQELILGATTAVELAARYETWVAANDSNRGH
jgi:raffinose/stachyose/melibiose transport system substrate-binding protein